MTWCYTCMILQLHASLVFSHPLHEERAKETLSGPLRPSQALSDHEQGTLQALSGAAWLGTKSLGVLCVDNRLLLQGPPSSDSLADALSSTAPTPSQEPADIEDLVADTSVLSATPWPPLAIASAACPTHTPASMSAAAPSVATSAASAAPKPQSDSNAQACHHHNPAEPAGLEHTNFESSDGAAAATARPTSSLSTGSNSACQHSTPGQILPAEPAGLNLLCGLDLPRADSVTAGPSPVVTQAPAKCKAASAPQTGHEVSSVMQLIATLLKAGRLLNDVECQDSAADESSM